MSENTPVTGVASFGGSSSANGLILPEIDKIMHLDKDGEETTDLGPEDPVYFTLHHASSVTIIRVLDTDGGDIQRVGEVTRDKTEQLSFDHSEHELELSHIPDNGVSAKWYGRESELKLNDRKLTAADAPCLGEISYTYSATQYLHTPIGGLTLSPGESFPVDIKVEYQVED